MAQNKKGEEAMVARAQTKKSQKSAREVTGKDAVIGMNLIRTEKNVLIQNIKKGLPISAFEKIQKELAGFYC
jgi:hypothetical protein